MGFSEVLNLILGGGLMTAFIAIVTLKATVRKANAEAEKANADAETVRIDNTEHATRILIQNIVEPLKEELSATREQLQETEKALQATKREMARLRKAIDTANSCKHRDDCPVLYGVREFAKIHAGNESHSNEGKRRQSDQRKEGGDNCGDSEIGGEDDNSDGQPP